MTWEARFILLYKPTETAKNMVCEKDFITWGGTNLVKENKGPDRSGPLFSSSHNGGQAQEELACFLFMFVCAATQNP